MFLWTEISDREFFYSCKRGESKNEANAVRQEFDLVCEKKWLKSTLQSVYFVGYLIGSIVFGVLSDRFGRKLTFFMTNLFFSVCGVSKIFMPSFVVFMIFHCMQGSGFMGVAISTYALRSFWVSLALLVLGKFGIAAAFSSIYLLSAEIFPTVVR
ncbi:organic cation transporter protein-like [Octopus vulgaris]|uniref:Organic cation transporter protein-like n=1 Tax=Octopus vulgaris TaxID=6645 RepID=A0AA36BD65_OCTVU|nr:organic cation transporter protein-like [Octopus vulgaris]